VIDPATVLAHRPPNLLLEAVLEVDDQRCRSRVRVDPGAWYAGPDGSAPGWLGLEWMAQTVAAFSGSCHAGEGRPPRPGYLLGTRLYRCDRPTFPGGAVLEVEAVVQYADPAGLSAFQCEIRQDGARVAQAVLTVYEP
jgi:predicted hotdog family 3-hydroxylacyl-ACP dehydratase